jgi:hypothetical protein
MEKDENGDFSIVRDNLMNREGYEPYCGAGAFCSKGMPRAKWDFKRDQFVCGCGWISKFHKNFIERYKKRWKL